MTFVGSRLVSECVVRRVRMHNPLKKKEDTTFTSPGEPPLHLYMERIMDSAVVFLSGSAFVSNARCCRLCTPHDNLKGALKTGPDSGEEKRERRGRVSEVAAGGMSARRRRRRLSDSRVRISCDFGLSPPTRPLAKSNGCVSAIQPSLR